MKVSPALSYLCSVALQRAAMFRGDASDAKRRMLAKPRPNEQVQAQQRYKTIVQPTIAQIIADALYPTRFEPESTVSLHRNVPTSGGCYPIDLILVDWSKAIACISDPDRMEMVPLAWRPPLDSRNSDNPNFFLVARMDRLLDRYGDIAWSLVNCEAGMIAAQLAISAQAHNASMRFAASADPRSLLQHLGVPDWQILPIIEGHLTKTALFEQIEDERGQKPLQMQINGLPSDVERAPLTVSLLDSEVDRGTVHSYEDFSISQDIAEQLILALPKRTSDGSRSLCAFSQIFHSDEIAEFALSLCDAVKHGKTESAAPYVATCMIVSKTPLGLTVCDYDLATGELRNPDKTGANSFFESMDSTELIHGINCYLTIRYPQSEGFDRSMLQACYIDAGRIAQLACVLSACRDWFCRPVKNFDEPAVAGCLDRDQYPLLKLEIGKLEQQPTSFDLHQTSYIAPSSQT